MKTRLTYSAAVIIALAFSGPLLAGKGGGGMGGPDYQRSGSGSPGQMATSQQRSDRSDQQNRQRERYREREVKRHTRKSGENPGMDDQIQLREQNQFQ